MAYTLEQRLRDQAHAIDDRFDSFETRIPLATQNALNAKQPQNYLLSSISTLSLAGKAGYSLKATAAEDGFELLPIDTTVLWGGITGTLANQTDLQAALDGKQPTGNYATGGGTATGTNTGDQFTNMTTSRLLGRVTAGFGVAEELTAEQTKTLLGVVIADVSGLQGALDAKFDKTGGTVTGNVTVQAASAATGSIGHWIRDELGVAQALLFWNRSDDSVRLRRYDAAGTAVEGGEIRIFSTGFVFSGNAQFTGNLRSSNPTGGVGYMTGAGGTVTQATSKATAVTLDKACGEIAMNGEALAAGAIVSFTLNNTAIATGDVLVLNHVSPGTRGAYSLNAQTFGGAAIIFVRNNTAASLAEAIAIRFAVIKATTA